MKTKAIPETFGDDELAAELEAELTHVMRDVCRCDMCEGEAMQI